MANEDLIVEIEKYIEADLEASKCDAVIDKLSEALKQNENDSEILTSIRFLLAKTCLKLKYFQQAQYLVEELLLENPFSEDFLALQVKIYEAIRTQGLENQLQQAQKQKEIFNILKYGYQLLKCQAFPLKTHTILSETLFTMGKTRLAQKHLIQALKYDPHNKDLLDNMVSYLQYAPNTESIELFTLAKQYETMAFPNYQEQSLELFDYNPRTHKTKLRLGFVSGDFKRHAIFFWIGHLFPELKKLDLEIFCYCNNPHDDITDIFINQSDQWRDIANLNDLEAAKLIFQDKIDILIDLSGHTVLNRLGIFSLKPSPIQVSWLGQFGPLGIKNIDYVISDPTLFNKEEQTYYSEKVYTLPNIYASFNKEEGFACDRKIPESPHKKNGFISFGSFTNMIKLNRDCFDLWIKILKSVPDSRLYLKNHALANSDLRIYVSNYFLQKGISQERLILEGASEIRGEYLDCYAKVDICLDSVPVGGYTTNLDVLYMGIPLITLYGNKMHHRTGSSLLKTIGLEELITFSPDEYHRKAIELASNLELLASYKHTIRRKLLESNLFKANQFAHDFANAMRDMWRTFVNDYTKQT